MNKEHRVSGNTHSKEQLNHYANQHNPNNSAYQANRDNRSNQCNPNNKEYDHSRGSGQKRWGKRLCSIGWKKLLQLIRKPRKRVSWSWAKKNSWLKWFWNWKESARSATRSAGRSLYGATKNWYTVNKEKAFDRKFTIGRYISLQKEVTRGAAWEPTYSCLTFSRQSIITALRKASMNITSLTCQTHLAPWNLTNSL